MRFSHLIPVCQEFTPYPSSRIEGPCERYIPKIVTQDSESSLSCGSESGDCEASG